MAASKHAYVIMVCSSRDLRVRHI